MPPSKYGGFRDDYKQPNFTNPSNAAESLANKLEFRRVESLRKEDIGSKIRKERFGHERGLEELSQGGQTRRTAMNIAGRKDVAGIGVAGRKDVVGKQIEGDLAIQDLRGKTSRYATDAASSTAAASLKGANLRAGGTLAEKIRQYDTGREDKAVSTILSGIGGDDTKSVIQHGYDVIEGMNEVEKTELMSTYKKYSDELKDYTPDDKLRVISSMPPELRSMFLSGYDVDEPVQTERKASWNPLTWF